MVVWNGVDLGVSVDKEDVLAIAVSKHESDLLAQEDKLQAEYRILAKEKKDLEKSLDKGTKAFLEASLGGDLKLACTALEKATMGSFSHSVSLTKVDLEDGVARFQSQIRSNSGRYGETLSASGEVDLPGDLLGKAHSINDLTDRLRENAEARIQVKKELGRIGTVERQAKAHIAIQSLSSTEEGKAFLESIQQGSGLFLTDTKSGS